MRWERWRERLWESLDESAVMRALSQRGPKPGWGHARHGNPSLGVCEFTPQIRATWYRAMMQARGVHTPKHLTLRVNGREVTLQVEEREHPFGAEWQWLCPECFAPCRVVYITAHAGVACRRCSRLIYFSQKYRSTSAWAVLDALISRRVRYDDPIGGIPEFMTPAIDALHRAIRRQWEEALGSDSDAQATRRERL